MSRDEFVLNAYARELSQSEIDGKVHRDFVGGLWEQVGTLQFEFLVRQGLSPDSFLLDIGCGALRGGIHFVRYLNAGHYFGLDINQSLVDAGRQELKDAGLQDKNPSILVNDLFEFELMRPSYDYLIAQSVFTHLPINHIVRCFVQARRVMHEKSILFATFFKADEPACLDEIAHSVGGVVSHYDKDPFHYSIKEFEWMAGLAGLSSTCVGEWGHPRGQQMLSFSVAK